MMEVVAQKLRLMGGAVELVDIGEQEVSERANWHLPASHKSCHTEILELCT